MFWRFIETSIQTSNGTHIYYPLLKILDDGLEPPNAHFPMLKSIYNHFSHRRNVARLSLFYRAFHGKCLDKLYSLSAPVHIFTARTHYDTYKPVNPSSLFSYSFGKEDVPLRKFIPQNCYIIEQGSEKDASSIATILTSSGVGSLYREYLTYSELYLNKNRIRPQMVYCCYIWAGTSQS